MRYLPFYDGVLFERRSVFVAREDILHAGAWQLRDRIFLPREYFTSPVFFCVLFEVTL